MANIVYSWLSEMIIEVVIGQKPASLLQDALPIYSLEMMLIDASDLPTPFDQKKDSLDELSQYELRTTNYSRKPIELLYPQSGSGLHFVADWPALGPSNEKVTGVALITHNRNKCKPLTYTEFAGGYVILNGADLRVDININDWIRLEGGEVESLGDLIINKDSLQEHDLYSRQVHRYGYITEFTN